MTKKQLRQKNVIQRLELQLKSGVKPSKEGVKNAFVDTTFTILLEPKDIIRINKEIEILKTSV